MAFLRGEVGDRVFKSIEESSDPRRLAKLPGILSSGRHGMEWQLLAEPGLDPRRRPKSYSPVPRRASNCASPRALSADNEEVDLAGEGRFKAEVGRIGLSDRRIEGEDGLLVSPVPFRSGNIDSDATSVFDLLADGWAERGRRVAAIPEPLLPSMGERGCFSRGDN